AARQVVVECALDAVDLPHGRARSGAGGNAPAMLAIAGPVPRILDAVLLVDVGGPTTVLKVVDALLTHQGVLNAAEVDPDVRKLVDEERAGVEKLVAINLLPGVGRGPVPVGVGGQRVRRRAKAEA